MEQDNEDELVEKILSASLRELFDILDGLDLNNCPEIVKIAWSFRHHAIFDEIDRKLIDGLKHHIAGNEDRSVQVGEFKVIPERSEIDGEGNLRGLWQGI